MSNNLKITARFTARKTRAACGVAFACLASLAAFAQSPGYDESSDLQRLAQHSNSRMHYLRLSSPLRDKPQIWEGLEEVIEALPTSSRDYVRLERLILEKSVAELQNRVAVGELTYEEITRFFIARIHAIETDDTRYLNAVIALNPAAVDEAREADRRRIEVQPSPESFFGLPVLLKDNIGFAGMPTTAGAAALSKNVTADAFMTERLKSNGVVILGKANLSEWAYFFCTACPSGYSAMGGQTLNPYGRLEFNTGGSSAGSGAAIAGGFAVAAVGSETAGSILSPSSANSLVGLKPTTGSISRTGVIPISSTLDTLGPMGRSVADIVSLFNAMTGYDQSDSAMPLLSEDLHLSLRRVDIQGLRLGFPRSLQSEPLLVEAVSKLEAAGAVVVPVDFAPPDLQEEVQFMGAEMVIELTAYLAKWANSQVSIGGVSELLAYNSEALNERAPYGQALVEMMAEFERLLNDDRPAALAELERLRNMVREQTGGYLMNLFADNQLDVLVRINNSGASAGALANYPALTIPAGYRDNGQPLGITLYAPSFQEQLLIDLGVVLESAGPVRRSPEGY